MKMLYRGMKTLALDLKPHLKEVKPRVIQAMMTMVEFDKVKIICILALKLIWLQPWVTSFMAAAILGASSLFGLFTQRTSGLDKGIECSMISGEGDVYQIGASSWVIEEKYECSIDAFLRVRGDEEVSLVDGVLEGALGALGDEIRSLGDGVFMSSWVKSTNNCFGGMMLIFGLLETLEIEAL
ncbi:hypothetical protein Tco_0364021 [Tanacetum coccineum]